MSANIAGNEWSWTTKPNFPISITIDGGLCIELNADGTWTADIEAVGALRKTMTEMKHSDATTAVLLWLILREMERTTP